jgi:hypothetical protein
MGAGADGELCYGGIEDLGVKLIGHLLHAA